MSYLNDIEFIINNIYFDFDYSDKIKTKEQFNYLVDNLSLDNLISEKTRQNIYLSMDSKKRKTWIVCGCYKRLIDHDIKKGGFLND